MRGLKLVGVGLWLALVAFPAAAVEPTTVTVEGVVQITKENENRLRDLALQAGLTESVLSVARMFATRQQLGDDEARVRAALEARASAYVLTYTVDGAPKRRGSSEGGEEYVLALTATVDAAPVRAQLRALGVLRSSRERPSVALYVVPDSETFPGARELLVAFEQYVGDTLRDDGFIVVEPALRATTGGRSQGGVDLARAVGADVALEMVVGWRDRSLSAGVVGGNAEVRARALRARDGFELARSRFDAPGYYETRDEAFVRALEALQDQLAQNLLSQLNRNWKALADDDAPVFLTLSNVTSYAQVKAIQQRLAQKLGAREASLFSVGPHSAEILIHSRLSAGALQDRLAATHFNGFRLEPVAVRRNRVELRVGSLEP